MLIPLIITFFLALLCGYLFEKMKLPALLGYLLIGLCFSPYMLEFLQPNHPLINNSFISHTLINNSAILREIALFIILFRAGLGLDREGLKTHGMNALSLSVLPCLLEAAVVTFAAHLLFNLPLIESSIIGFIVAAVSPAVIVPQMLELQKKNIGTNKKIPTLVLAGSTVDDIIAISGFGICLSLLNPLLSEDWRLMALKVPFSIISGLVIGYYTARPIVNILKKSYLNKICFVPILICVAFGFKQLEDSNLFFFSHLIAILTMGIAIQAYDFNFSESLSKMFAQVWYVAVVILFVLIGAMVNPKTALDAGFYGLIILIIGLSARSLGVYFSLMGSKLNAREKLFCVIAYLPKATVQATVGGITLSMFLKGKIWLHEGAQTGDLIIAIAALSIIITAPLGAIGIRIFSKKLLKPDSSTSDIS
ncbi:MAG: cation:proton antiporter [Lentisphaeraceae bacterium]|nr:cation:proton antiporter [Lentisphaeraceae bacterium]